MNDILGFGKMLPMDKLVEVTSRACGRISKAYFERKDYDTQAYGIKKIAEAESEAMMIVSKTLDKIPSGKEIEYHTKNLSIKNSSPIQPTIDDSSIQPIEARIEQRINFKNLNSQRNIETVTALAAKELKDNQYVTDKPLSNEWISRFFTTIEEISSNEMQLLWAKILAGEIKEPESFSLRTLELLKNLTQDEAKVFNKFANLALKIKHDPFIYFKDNKIEWLKDKFNIAISDILLMNELGLISSERMGSIVLTGDGLTDYIIYGDKVVRHTIKNTLTTNSVGILIFTTPGIQLCNLIEPKIDVDYLREFCCDLMNENVTVEYGDLKKDESGKIEIINPINVVK